MSGVILPRPADRETVLGFWVTLTLLTGGALLALLAAVGWLSYAAALLLGALTVSALFTGLSRERAIYRVYLRWNRAAQWYARPAREAVLAIWYGTVFAAVARTGGSTLEKEGSDWLPRGTLRVPAYSSLTDTTAGAAPSGTLRDYLIWAVHSRRLWLVFVLPLFLLLRVLDPRGSRAAPSDIYTLY